MPDSRVRLDEFDIFVSALVAETQILNTAQSCSQYRGQQVNCSKPVNLLDLQVNEY